MKINDSDNNTFSIDVEKGDSDQLKKIVAYVLPPLFELFARKNKEYGGAEEELGISAQFVDMNRKFRKLKIAMWDGEPEDLTSESLEEVLQDLAGHVFLTLSMLHRSSAEKLVRQIPNTPPDFAKNFLSEIEAE